MSIRLLVCKPLQIFWSANGQVNGHLYHLALWSNQSNMIHLKRLFLIEDYGSVLDLSAVGSSPSCYSLYLFYCNINESAAKKSKPHSKSVDKHLKISNLILVKCARQTGI